MKFNRYKISDEKYDHYMSDDVKEAINLYEITENIEEYYKQKAPNLWNAWVRTNNILIEQQERLDKLERTLKTISENVIIGGSNDGIVNNNVLNLKKEVNERIDKLDNNINKIKDYLLQPNSRDKKLSR